jgi:large subunit ribosomal protein L16
VLFELEGISKPLAEKAMALASAKMPIRTKFVAREDLQHSDAGGKEEGDEG